MKTKKDIMYRTGGANYTTIPAGTTVTRARNLPETPSGPRYWAKGWRGMGELARSHARNYGFLLTLAEVKGE
jgi:hypothetical protein